MPTSPATLSRQCAPRQVIHLDAHRPVVMRVDDGSDTAHLQTAVMVYQPERRLSDVGSGVRLAEPHVPTTAKRPGVIVKPLGDGYPSCQSDACRQRRARCPTPQACRLPDDPEDVHRGPLALIAIGFLAGVASEHRVIVSVVLAVLLVLLGAHLWHR